MEETKKKRLTSWGLLVIAMVLTFLGMLAIALYRGISDGRTEAELEAILNNSGMVIPVTAALIFKQFSVAVVPIFALLLVEAFHEGERFNKNIFGLALLAVLSEIPFNLLVQGKVFDFTCQNPVFALVLCELLLWVYNRFSQKGFWPAVVWILATVAAVVICNFARIQPGVTLVLSVCVFWSFRKKADSRDMAAVVASILCIIWALNFGSVIYFTAPISALFVHFYGGKHSEKMYLPLYASYPLGLLVAWGISFLF